MTISGKIIIYISHYSKKIKWENDIDAGFRGGVVSPLINL
jgi:hypothetical protein